MRKVFKVFLLLFLSIMSAQAQMGCNIYSYYYTSANAVFYSATVGYDSVVINMYPWESLDIQGFEVGCNNYPITGSITRNGQYYASSPQPMVFSITLPGIYQFWGEYPDWKIYKVYFNQTTGIAEEEKEQIGLYPNPAHDVISISGDTRDYEIYLTDITQRIILQIPQSSFPDLDISNLSSGIYYLVFHSDSEKFVRKFVRM